MQYPDSKSFLRNSGINLFSAEFLFFFSFNSEGKCALKIWIQKIERNDEGDQFVVSTRITMGIDFLCMKKSMALVRYDSYDELYSDC